MEHEAKMMLSKEKEEVETKRKKNLAKIMMKKKKNQVKKR